MSNEIIYDELGWKETMLLGVAISEGMLDAISGGRWRAEVVADDLKLNARAV